MEDRLNHIRKRLKQCKVYYSRYSPRSDMMYEIDEADDDLSWMIYEIERLREESRELRERLESSSGEL
jgi:hypothetical protein